MLSLRLRYFPGLVNLQVWCNHLWLPRPFGPRFPEAADGADTFEVGANGAIEHGLHTTHYIDNWDTYHTNFGEVHCGTNVLRFPAQQYQEWWDYEGN